jgi:hypothetical protein
MDQLDAGYPRLYRATSLTVTPIRSLMEHGEYRDEHGLRVGQFDVATPRDHRWGDHRATEVTEIRDGDGTVFMVVVHRARDYVMADPDGTEVATLRPSSQLFGQRLHVRVTLAEHGTGSLRETRRGSKRGIRSHDLSFGTTPPAARVTSHFEGSEIVEVTLAHDAGASPPQRCASLALATCLRQMLVTGPSLGGGPTYG